MLGFWGRHLHPKAQCIVEQENLWRACRRYFNSILVRTTFEKSRGQCSFSGWRLLLDGPPQQHNRHRNSQPTLRARVGWQGWYSRRRKRGRRNYFLAWRRLARYSKLNERNITNQVVLSPNLGHVKGKSTRGEQEILFLVAWTGALEESGRKIKLVKSSCLTQFLAKNVDLGRETHVTSKSQRCCYLRHREERPLSAGRATSRNRQHEVVQQRKSGQKIVVPRSHDVFDNPGIKNNHQLLHVWGIVIILGRGEYVRGQNSSIAISPDDIMQRLWGFCSLTTDVSYRPGSAHLFAAHVVGHVQNRTPWQDSKFVVARRSGVRSDTNVAQGRTTLSITYLAHMKHAPFHPLTDCDYPNQTRPETLTLVYTRRRDA